MSLHRSVLRCMLIAVWLLLLSANPASGQESTDSTANKKPPPRGRPGSLISGWGSGTRWIHPESWSLVFDGTYKKR